MDNMGSYLCANINEIIKNNYFLESDYDEFLNLKNMSDNLNEEKKVSDYINWLIDKIDYENAIVCEHTERLVFFREINSYIERYVQINGKQKNLLLYLYQMIYIQNSIFLGHFNEAKKMFISMMKNEDIQFNVFETLGETNKTSQIFENTGVFSFLFATWCNMNQLAYFVKDDKLKLYLTDHNLFYGIPILQENRIDDNIEIIKNDENSTIPLYYKKQQQLIEELRSFDNEIETKIIFRIDNSEVIKSFHEYTYSNGKTKDIMLEFFDYEIENDNIIIKNYGEIAVNEARKSYVPFSQRDLE